jgi:hypothetical protein
MLRLVLLPVKEEVCPIKVNGIDGEIKVSMCLLAFS